MIDIIMFLAMTLCVFVFTYLIGGQASLMFLYMFVFAYIISIIFVIMVKNKLQIYVNIPVSEVEKNTIVKVDVVVRNKSFIPIPFVDIIFFKTSNFKLAMPSTIRISIGALQSKIITMEYLAQNRGKTSIGVKDVIFRDYLNILKFSLLRYIVDKESSKEITVLPEIITIKPNSKILLSSNDSQKNSNDNEYAIHSSNFTGEMGYEFREYTPGDSLKRIHWKMSAKRDVFMVRQDQTMGIQRKILILDPGMKTILIRKESEKISLVSKVLNKSNFIESMEETMAVEEKVLEALLAIINSFISANITVDLFLFEKGQWRMEQIQNYNNINELQYTLAVYKFENISSTNFLDRISIPNIIEEFGRKFNGCENEVIFFTGVSDSSLVQLIDNCGNYNISLNTILIRSVFEYSKFEQFNNHNLWIAATNDDFYEVLS